MTADEVAAFLGVDRNTVFEYTARGTIPHRRVGQAGAVSPRGARGTIGSMQGRFDSDRLAVPVRRGKVAWSYRVVVRKPDGTHERCATRSAHAALFGVNPCRLPSWMGHKRIDGR